MDVLTLDGSYHEGGGQILRTALSLSAVTGRPFRLVKIRAGRSRPGLLPQHLLAVRSAAAICRAVVSGDAIGSGELEFVPRHPPAPGCYVFDVAEAAERGSAGSVTLVLQTLAVPLALAGGPSSLVLRGGTHVEWSPPFDHVAASYLPMLRRMGLELDVELKRWGWYPAGKGEIHCTVAAGPAGGEARPRAIELTARGDLRRIGGRAVAANLPAHIPQRMSDRARSMLGEFGVPVQIDALRVTAACPGAGIFLTAEYENAAACFNAYGRQGKSSEAVAEDAVMALREHHASGAAVEIHLADQLLLPLALADGVSSFTVSMRGGHLVTNAWTIGQFGTARITFDDVTPCRVTVEPLDRQ
jgi:RNA 3'-terminal phosphate cyclase (ATP)